MQQDAVAVEDRIDPERMRFLIEAADLVNHASNLLWHRLHDLTVQRAIQDRRELITTDDVRAVLGEALRAVEQELGGGS